MRICLLAIILITFSCTNEKETHTEIAKDQFDYTFYETNKNHMIDLKSFNFEDRSTLSRLEINNMILDEINQQLDTSLDFDESFKSLELTSYEHIENYIITNQILEDIDLAILNEFYSDLNSHALIDAVVMLENNVILADLAFEKREKFEYLANVVLLIENETPGFFDSTMEQRSCAGALLSLAFATAGLAAACNPPAAGATVGVGCYLAAANFVRASATVGIECGDDHE